MQLLFWNIAQLKFYYSVSLQKKFLHTRQFYIEESKRKNELRTPCVSKMAIALYRKRLYKCKFQFELWM